MTKSTITREQLLEIIETDHVQCGEASYLARMALAAMDGEPVAWLLSGGGTKNVVCFDSGNAYADPLREVTPLYRHAQPVPVVPGKWIPVSERMPEKGQAVLVYRPKAHEGGDSDVRVAVYGRHNFEHGFGCYWEPSHWMPLPAAPQEVGDA
ncbi:DUF551 domain-containing protein [Klebsiella pneumoniae]